MGSVAIYGRASIDKTERRISVDRQVARCRALAEDLWPGRVPVVFTDNNLSGSNPDVTRPQWDRLMAAIRAGEIEHVVAHEQSRLTRQPAQWDQLVVALTRAGIDKVHTVSQGAVPVNPGNRLLGRILAVVDADESERTSRRALAMHEHIADEGRPNGGRYYGYRRQYGPDGRPELVIDEDEARVVRLIIDGLAAGRPAGRIAEQLTAGDVPTGRDGRRWWSSTVLGVARRPHIAGLRLHNGKVVGDGRWEPIVDRARWERVQQIIGNAGGQPSRPRRHLLTGGIARCGVCGAPVSTTQQKRPKGYVQAYACSVRSWTPGACGKVALGPISVVEDLVACAVLERLRSPAAAAALTNHDDGDQARAFEEIAAAEARVARAAEMYGAGELDERTWRQMHQAARKAADEARGRLGRLGMVDIDLPALERIWDEWATMPLEQRRAVISRLVERVVILPRTGRRPADPYERVTERLDIRWR